MIFGDFAPALLGMSDAGGGGGGGGDLFLVGQLSTAYGGRTPSDGIYIQTFDFSSLSPQAGDLAVVSLTAMGSGANDMTVPSGEGYTRVLRAFADGSSADVTGEWHIKVLGGGESTVEIYTWTSSSPGIAVMFHLFRNADTTNPLDVSPAILPDRGNDLICPRVEPISTGAIALFSGGTTGQAGGVHTNSGVDNLLTQSATASFTTYAAAGTNDYTGSPITPSTFVAPVTSLSHVNVSASLVIRPAGSGNPAFSYAPYLAAKQLLNGDQQLVTVGSATFTVPEAPDGLADDIIIVGVFFDNNVGSAPGFAITPPADFTQIGSQVVDGGRAMSLFWKRATGAGGTATFDYTASTSGMLIAKAVYLRGALASGTPVEGVASNTGTGITMTGADVTTTVDNALVVSFFGVAEDYVSDPATGWLEAVEVTTTTGTDAAIVISLREKVTAGTQSGESRTLGASESWINISCAVKPA